jgi:hypothetical protein
MISLSDAVHTAVYARLAAGVTLATVYAIAPEGTQPPVVIIADAVGTVEVEGLERFEVRIASIVSGASKKSLFALMLEIQTALENVSLTFTGAVLSRPVFLGSDDRLGDDGLALIGEQRFLVFAQPAD